MASQLSPIKLQQENYRLQAELTELRSRHESLQKSETRYRQAFENAPISMLCISTEGKPIEMNSAAEQFLGWTIADANETGFNGFTNPTLVENGTIASVERAIAGETVIEPPMSFEPSSTIGQGSWKWVQGHYYPIRDAAGQVQEVVEVALDLTAIYEVQQKLDRERISLLQASAQVANLLLKAPDYTTVLSDVVKLLGEAVGSDRCGVMQDVGLHPTLNRPGIKTLIGWNRSNVHSSDELTPPPDRVYLWDDVPESYETLAQGKVFNRLVADLQEPGRSLLQAQGNTSCLFVPILVNDCLWGLFAFDNCGEPRLYDEAEIAILQVAAESIAAAIARQAQDEQLRESEHRYRQLMDLAGEGIFRVEYEQPISVDLPVKEQAKQIYQQFRYAEHNLAFAQMYGYDRVDALVGKYLAHVTDAPENAIQMEKFVQNGHRMRNQETVEIDRFGSKRYFLNNGFSIIRDGFAIGGWGTQIDITELRETQQALLEAEQERCLRLASQSLELEHLNTKLQQTLDRLSESEERYRTLFELSNEGIYRFEIEQPISIFLPVEEQVDLALQYYRFAEANAAFYAQMEVSNMDELVEFTLKDFHGNLEQNRRVNLAIVQNGYQIKNAETEETDTLGKQKFFLNNIVCDIREGFFLGGWCMQTDITELRLAQQSLLKAEQDRVTKLAKTDRVFKNSLARLADNPDIDSFLGYLLLEITEQLKLDFAAVRLYDSATQTLPLKLQVWQGQIKLKHQIEATEAYLCPSTANVPIWDILLQTKQPFLLDREHNQDYCTEDYNHQINQLQLQVTINLLLTLGDEPIGQLVLGYIERTNFTLEELELAQALAQQATLAIQLTRLAEEAKQSAIFEERNRLAGEIHDTLAQTFTGISVQLELAQYLSQNNPTEVESILDRIASLAQTGLAEARRSVWSIYPTSEDYSDLAQKLADCVKTLTAGTELHTQVRITGDPYPLSCFVGKNLLRIGQESITNTLKHSQATELQVKLTYTPNQVSLCISDNGCGFCPQTQTEGFGLIGISERSDRIGGQLRITTQPEQGTEILVQVSR